MADLVVSAAELAPVFPPKDGSYSQPELYSHRLVSGLAKGDAVYEAGVNGLAQSAASVAGTARFHGLIVSTSYGAISLLTHGHVYGFDLSALNPGDLVYLSNTAGKLGTAAGTVSVVAGRVTALTDSGVWTKVLFIDANWRS